MNKNGGDDDCHRAKGIGQHVQEDAFHIFIAVVVMLVTVRAMTVGMGMRMNGLRWSSWEGRVDRRTRSCPCRKVVVKMVMVLDTVQEDVVFRSRMLMVMVRMVVLRVIVMRMIVVRMISCMIMTCMRVISMVMSPMVMSPMRVAMMCVTESC